MKKNKIGYVKGDTILSGVIFYDKEGKSNLEYLDKPIILKKGDIDGEKE